MIRRLGPALYLVVVVLLAYWPLTSMQDVLITDDIFTSDLQNSFLPMRHSLGQAIRHGEWPLWVPEVYGGFPLLAHPIAGAAYPPNWFLFGLFSPGVALNLLLLFTLLTAALSMYLLAVELTGSTAGALIAGLGYSFSGFMVCHLKHVSLVTSVSWFPLGLLYIERGAKPRALLGLSAVFALQILSGGFQTTYYAGIAYLAYAFVRLPSRRHALGALALGAGIGAVQILPTLELVSRSRRATGVGIESANQFSYDLRDFWTFFWPYLNGDASDLTYGGTGHFWEDFGYVGLITLLLALCSRGAPRWWWLSAAAAYLMVLGPATPVFGLAFQYFPGMKFFRFPTRFLFVVATSLSVLAAFGFRALEARLAGRRPWSDRPGSLGVLTVLLVTADLVSVQRRQHAYFDMGRWLEPPRTARRLLEDRGEFRIFSPGASTKHREVFLAARAWSGDLELYRDQLELIQPNINLMQGLSTPDGYTELTPDYLLDVWGDHNQFGLAHSHASVKEGRLVPTPVFIRLLSLFNVKYLLCSWPVTGGGLEDLGGEGMAHLYRNPAVMPRAFVTGRARVVPDRKSALEALQAADFEPAREVILEERPETPGAGEASGAQVRVTRRERNELELAVTSPTTGFLVLSDSYDPGWKATVNGVETPVYRANVCQRAVAVPGGSKTVVRLRYAPPTAAAGLALTILSLGIFLILLGRASRPVTEVTPTSG